MRGTSWKGWAPGTCVVEYSFRAMYPVVPSYTCKKQAFLKCTCPYWMLQVRISFRQCIPNSTGSFKLDRQETGVPEVYMSLLDVAGSNLL
jgi:hypothetical protein